MLFASVSYRIIHPSSGFCFSVHFLFPLIYLVIGFSTGSFFRSELFQISQFSFVFDSLSFSFSLSLCVSQPRSFSLSSIHPFHPNALVPKRVFAPRMDSAKGMQISELVDVIITRLRWTYADQSVKICYCSKYSGLVSPSQPKSRKCKVRIDPESHSFSRLYEVLCYHALENTDPALEDALTYMQLIYPLSRAA